MAVTAEVCEFGRQAPEFSLPGVDGKTHTLQSVRGEKGTLVMFICNHCPYVKTILDRLVADMKTLQDNGIGVAAVMSNDPTDYPEDSVDNMKKVAADNGFTFPYLIDESQEIGRAYEAVCTPDFFGYNADLELQYRGRLDSVRPRQPAQGGESRDLVDAMLAIAATGRGPAEQISSMGCSIKWRRD